MSTTNVDILLIGGGVASASAAAELRARGFTGSVALVTRELDAPYHRPPVTKGLLTGRDTDVDASPLVHDETWWAEHDVELRTRSAVMSLDLEARTAKLASKDEIAFGGALIATGAMVRRLGVDGAQLEGIHYLRAPGNARALRGELEAAEHVVVIGGSFIGTEVAASLTSLGKRCTILMQEEWPLQRVFGDRAGRFVAGLLREHGVEVITAEDVIAFEGETRVDALRTASGLRLETDLVVVGAGAIPDVSLARKSGLELGETGGVLCDRYLRTSAEGVYAAGDMCEYDSEMHGARLRVEHEEHAIEQGRTAARNLLGEQVAHAEVPYFWSELADWVTLESLGPAVRWDSEIVTGSVEDGRFSVWYVLDDRIVGMLSVGQPENVAAARPLIAARAPSARLRDWTAEPDASSAAGQPA
jgi:3-phenylpropionate/trans-cinnamate dioxygenase ferredoxin reductase subunit